MDTRLFARKDCPLCKGRGRVRTGEHLGQEAICLCAIAGKRLADAERIIEQRFPERAATSMTLDNYRTGDDPKNEQALLVAQNFVDRYEEAAAKGWVLGFWGQTGSGKTHLASALAQECVRRYLAKPVLFNVPRELRRERERFRQTAPGEQPAASPIDRAINAELLILDDLGAEYHRQGADTSAVTWVYEQLYTILDERIMACRPTLFTSNWSPSDLRRRMDNEAGKRVWSRIERAQVTEALEVIEVPGANRQGESDEAKLFEPRVAKEFELRSKRSGRSKAYTLDGLLDVTARYIERHGEDALRDGVEVFRVMRDGKPAPRVSVDIDRVLGLLAKRAAPAAA